MTAKEYMKQAKILLRRIDRKQKEYLRNHMKLKPVLLKSYLWRKRYSFSVQNWIR